jgi:PAS domain S-box-containing protein
MLAPIHPDDRSRVEKTYEEADSAKRDFSLDYRIVHDDGRVTHIREVAEIENDENGNPVAQVGFVQDITEEKKVEENLREISGRFELAQRQAKVGYWRWSFVDKNLSYWSDEAAGIFRYPVDKPIGYEEMLSAVHPDDRDRIMREYEIADQKPCDYETEYRVLRGDGSVVHVREIGEVEYDENGKPTGHTGFVQDITELKEIESELRASEARLDGILTIAPEAIIVTGEDLTIRRFNQGAERIFGYTRAEMEGQTLNPLLPEQFREKHQAYVRDFGESSDPYRVMAARGEITGLRKDGTTFPAAASVAKLQLEGETVFVVALRDITERKLIEADLLAAKEEAEYANRAKSEFLANMSHELRTPLNSIIGFSQILSNQTFGPLGNPRYLEYANDIRNSGTHLLALIADILDISKIENRELVMDEEKLNIKQVVRECRKMVQARAEAAQLAVTTEIAADVHALLADRRLVMQILLNLLSNAIKFTPVGGQIMMRARLDARGATRLEVTDTGVGIAREDLPKVTHAFVQAGRKGGLYTQPGTGLGLSLVKSLVELHGGHFSIGSKLGLGTRAMAIFPPERTIRH